MKKIFFISDAHLGSEDEKKERLKESRLISFFEYLNNRNHVLYIVGDFFDFWFEYRYTIPGRYFQILSKLRQLIESGVEVNLVSGNHDYWLGQFLRKEVGINIHPGPLELSIENKKYFIAHGDGLAIKRLGDQLLKKILTNPVNIFLYRLLHPDVGIPLANFFSRQSRKHNSHKYEKDEPRYLAFAQKKFQEGFDVVILGHTHRPRLERTGEKCYLNLGDWMTNFTYGVLEEGKLKLERWNNFEVLETSEV